MKINVIILIILLPFFTVAQSDKQMTEETVKKGTIEGHIYFLASDELIGREAGQPGADIAAKYLATTFKRYGVSPVQGATNGYYQKIDFRKVTPPNETVLNIDNNTYQNGLSLTSFNTSLNADIIYIGYGMAEDFSKTKDYKGKILIAKAGSKDNNEPNVLFKLSQQKIKLAQEKQAAGLVEIHSFEDKYWNNMKGYFNHSSMAINNEDTNSENSIPHIWVKSDNMSSFDKMKRAKLSIKGAENEIVTSSNVVGMVEGTDPMLKDEFIIYSAHYDHIGVGTPNTEGDSIYNGARDNAVGTVTVLSAAENIAKYPTKRSALFILFTAEEKGLLGSEYYVENPLIPLNKMVYCFNSDNASYNDTTKATIVGLNRTTAEDHIKNAAKEFGLTAINDPAPEQNLFDRSDNVHFAKKGIPAPTFSLGFTAFDAEVFKYYHQPSDNPETIDYDYLVKFFRSYVLSCRNIANASETPFWVEGDKYYEAGINLYEK